MTENEYISATNLTKARIALHVVRDILPGFDGVTTDEEQTQIQRILSKWIDGLEKVTQENAGGGGE